MNFELRKCAFSMCTRTIFGGDFSTKYARLFRIAHQGGYIPGALNLILVVVAGISEDIYKIRFTMSPNQSKLYISGYRSREARYVLAFIFEINRPLATRQYFSEVGRSAVVDGDDEDVFFSIRAFNRNCHRYLGFGPV